MCDRNNVTTCSLVAELFAQRRGRLSSATNPQMDNISASEQSITAIPHEIDHST